MIADGWYRFGTTCAAHYYADGAKLCHFRHTIHEGTREPKFPDRAPDSAELSAHGVPFGRTCSRCLKLSKAAV